MEEIRLERIRRRELSRALRVMSLSPRDEATVEALSRALVRGLMRGPIAAAVPTTKGAGDSKARRDACAS